MRYSQQWSCVTVKDTDTCVLDQISTLPWVTKVFYICRNSCQLPVNKVCNFSQEWKWHGILSLRPFSMFLNCEWPPVLLPLGNWDFAICLQWGLLLTLTWPNIIKLYIMIWAMLVWHRNQGQFSIFTKYLLEKVTNKVKVSRHFVRMDFLSGRHFVKATLDVLSGPKCLANFWTILTRYLGNTWAPLKPYLGNT